MPCLCSLRLDGVYVVPAAPHGSVQLCHRGQPLCNGLSAAYMNAILAVLLAHSLRSQSHVVLQYILQAPTACKIAAS